MPANPDYVIVGAGMAGLSAAGYLARAGASVAVFEKHSKLGGFAQYFGNEPTYDSSTHLIGGFGSEGWTKKILSEIDVLSRVNLVPLDPVYAASFPAHQFVVRSTGESVRQELETVWPGEASGI